MDPTEIGIELKINQISNVNKIIKCPNRTWQRPTHVFIKGVSKYMKTDQRRL